MCHKRWQEKKKIWVPLGYLWGTSEYQFTNSGKLIYWTSKVIKLCQEPYRSFVLYIRITEFVNWYPIGIQIFFFHCHLLWHIFLEKIYVDGERKTFIWILNTKYISLFSGSISNILFFRPYYYGHHHFGKRSADAEPEAKPDAKADPWYYYSAYYRPYHYGYYPHYYYGK